MLKRKCKLYLRNRCKKTYSDDEVSREENVCRTCMRKQDAKYTKPRSKRKANSHDLEQLEKIAVLYE